MEIVALIAKFGPCAVEVVSFQVKATPYSQDVFIWTVITVRLEDTVYNVFFGVGNGTGFVVVVHEVITSAFSGITAIGWSPVVEYIIA